jgi:hypothetical protein
MQRFPAFSALLLIHCPTSMKKTIAVLSILFSTTLAAQSDTAFVPQLTVKWAPTALYAGNVSLQGEYKKTSTFQFEYDGNDALFDMKATSFLAGYRMYFSITRHMKGFYWESFFKYVHLTSEGIGQGQLDFREVNMRFTNDYNAVGVGVQLGVQFLVKKRWVIDVFFLGPEINSASNHLKATEAGDVIPWTYVEAKEAKAEVENFVNKFPLIRDHTTIMVDKDNKTVNADFKGALPGIRTGISIGFAF